MSKLREIIHEKRESALNELNRLNNLKNITELEYEQVKIKKKVCIACIEAYTDILCLKELTELEAKEKDSDKIFAIEGTPKHSGRYPWDDEESIVAKRKGLAEIANERRNAVIKEAKSLKAKGLSNVEIGVILGHKFNNSIPYSESSILSYLNTEELD